MIPDTKINAARADAELSDIIRALTPAFEEDGHILKAILFGSCVRGEATVTSDIDIAVISDAPSEIDRRRLIYIAESFGVDVDFVYTTPKLLYQAENVLDINYSIRTEGVTIWER